MYIGICICDLFLKTPENIDFAGFFNDNTHQALIKNNVSLIFNKYLAANRGKCYHLTSCKMPVKIHIFNAEILNEEKLLEVDFKGKKKINKRYHTVLTNALITSQFSHCTRVWMSHCKTMNDKINRIHKKA